MLFQSLGIAGWLISEEGNERAGFHLVPALVFCFSETADLCNPFYVI